MDCAGKGGRRVSTRGFHCQPAFGMIVCALLALGACQSAPPPDQMSRTTAETAPADLQLICATAVANSAGVDGSKVLPVGSRKIDAQSYLVDLNVDGKPMTCTVDNQGKVISSSAS